MRIKETTLRQIINEALDENSLYNQGLTRMIIAEAAQEASVESDMGSTSDFVPPESIASLESLIQSASPEAWALWKSMAGTKILMKKSEKSAVKAIIKKRAADGTLPELFQEYGNLMDQLEFENRGFFKKLGNQGPAFVAGSAMWAVMSVISGAKLANVKGWQAASSAALALMKASLASKQAAAKQERIHQNTQQTDFSKTKPVLAANIDIENFEFKDENHPLAGLEGDEKSEVLRFIRAKYPDEDPNKLGKPAILAIMKAAEAEMDGETRKNFQKAREDLVASMHTDAGQQVYDTKGKRASDAAPKSKPSDYDSDGNLTPAAAAAFEKQQASNKLRGDQKQAAASKLKIPSDPLLDAEEEEIEELMDDPVSGGDKALMDIMDLADEESAKNEGRQLDEIALTAGAAWLTWAGLETSYSFLGGYVKRWLESNPNLKGLATAFGAGSLSGLVMAMLKTIWDLMGKDPFKNNLIEWLEDKGFSEEAQMVDDALKERGSA